MAGVNNGPALHEFLLANSVLLVGEPIARAHDGWVGRKFGRCSLGKVVQNDRTRRPDGPVGQWLGVRNFGPGYIFRPRPWNS
jgi:hypothetical protein